MKGEKVMKEFLGKDFLLDDEVSKDLYFNHAEKMPIFDFHCHLIPKQIYENYQFKNITEVWLGSNGYGDHYKWRLLREFGVPEDYITGNKSDREKFNKFAEAMPYMVGNPIYLWTHFELKKFFNIDKQLSPETADEIWEKCNEKLKTLTAREMMYLNNVKTVFTTDDPVDDLHYHQLMAKDKTLKVSVKPAWRPDKAINVERKTFIPWVEALRKVTSSKVESLQEMLDALDQRLAFFVENGCAASDHALDVVHFKPNATYEEANAVFLKGLKGEKISFEEQDIYKGYVLVHLGKQYKKYNMVQEYHIGALRDNSERMFKVLGPDTGFDAAEDAPVAEKLSGLLNALDKTNELPKTILFNLNDKDFISLVTLKNCFQGGLKGKIQLGTSWWFVDTYQGMNKQLDYLSSNGLLSCFVGMLTDSRSFLSYPRHELFRRIVCQYIGKLVENGFYPDNRELLGKIVEDISYNNAVEFFKR